ncbi:MAG: FKBP-type peptidyl-prolyl cis-trans isomerase [Bacteroidales bacterium]|nr:FKBP-type peptidyl-prolyl cis-trans isomerase [Bacteroidales bacterium]MBN2697877.1 FKBP-type peptidyl-prolyl cis-trans isomerase [Bacteroidales bacterium]
MKKHWVKRNLIYLFMAGPVIACTTPVQESQEKGPDPVEEKFLDLNRYLQDKHQDHIRAFINRVGWTMEQTPTGLWFNVIEEGRGKSVEMNSRVTLTQSSLLLDGTLCYETPPGKTETIIAGKGNVMAGVTEGILKLKGGDSAVFIIPPHMGHGNFGDHNKIPGNSVIIYKVRVLRVN